MARFTLPRDVYHGKGCLSELKNLKGKKAVLVVGGGSMKRQGFLDKAVNYLKEGGMEVKLIDPTFLMSFMEIIPHIMENSTIGTTMNFSKFRKIVPNGLI